ncbi:MAG: hypothetical protein ACW99A_12925 [Candidatus Kariarchaeaceae archaeon]|jgi:cytoskeletal protein CcmA (bactofilin family)
MSDPSLVDKLKEKVVQGEITQEEYDYFYNKFTSLGIISENEEGSKQKKENIQVSGVKTTKGGIFGHIQTRGRLKIEGNTECDKLSVFGSLDVDGNLSVIKTCSISGSMIVVGDASFGGPISSTGSIKINGSLLSTSKLSSSGSIIVDKIIKTDHPLVFNGKLQCSDIQSSSNLKLSGKIDVEGNILAETLSISNGVIIVGGNILGKNINISGSGDNIDTDFLKDFEDVKDIPDLIHVTANFAKELIPNIGNLVTSVFDSITSQDGDRVNIHGDIEGNKIVISNAIVHGNIRGDEIVLGRNLQVRGKVEYTMKALKLRK